MQTMHDDSLTESEESTAPRLHRLRRVAYLRLGVDRALETAAHHSLHGFINRALTELEEASRLLERPDISRRPALLTIIDMELALAEYRVRAATLALALHGPDVEDIG
jgi:hypothetical protein